MAKPRSRGARLRLTFIIVTVASLAAITTQSSANVSHVFSKSFGAAGSAPANPYPLSGPTDVVIDQATSNVYVTDPANHRVEKFDSAGNFLLMFGKEVNKTKTEEVGSTVAERNVCASSSGDTCQAGTSSSSTGAFNTPAYLAVDNYPGGNGDIYVADTGDDLVQKFDSSGHVISTWGATGQKNGSDTDLTTFGPLWGVAVGNTTGDLYVGGNRNSSDNVFEFSRNGTYVGPYQNASGAPWLKADPGGNIFFVAEGGLFGPPTVTEGALRPGSHGLYNFYQMGTETPVTGFDFDPSSGELYQDTGSAIAHYSADCDPPQNGPCEPINSFGSGHLFGSQGVAVDGSSHSVLVANSTSNDVALFADARPIVTTGVPSEVSQSSVTLTGHIDPAGRGNVAECHFEYGFDKTYGHTVPCTPDPAGSPPASNFAGPTDVTATVTGLSAGTRDHYRLVASNTADATTSGADQIFVTTAPPAITGLTSENLTAISADLKAQINPNGLDTSYRFEYGITTDYGQVAPIPDGTLSASNTDQPVEIHLTELRPHFVYHYRLLAENDDGVTTADDHTFNFYPPNCPNENVRQQTEANYLPDCRAYELVSPGDAGGTQLFPYGPNSGYATSPSRFSFTGLFSTVPDSGGSPIDGTGDLYVATRTDAGWVSRYVGWPSSEAAVNGGPPMGPPGSTSAPYQPYPSNLSANGGSGPSSQNGVITNLAMDTFLSFNVGNQSIESIFGADFQNRTPIASNAPLAFAADGHRIGRWPTNLATVPDGQYPLSASIYSHPGYVSSADGPLTTSPGGTHSLDCPASRGTGTEVAAASYCPGDVTGSADLSHFVFASRWNVFAAGGQLSAPGSVYDNDTNAGTVTVASKTPDGEDIPSEPSNHAGDPLQIPAVSRDGSHILMAAGANGPCGFASCPTPPCGDYYTATVRCPMQPSHLYMRVNGAVTYDVSKGHAVEYVGAIGDGTKVYFSSEQQLTPEDHDSSSDLYQWTEASDSVTLISARSNSTGNSDACNVGFTVKCGILTYSTRSYCQLQSSLGGNCISDNFIASGNGDIYFFSPELLDGSRGIPNQENLYVFQNNQVQYVTTLTPAEPYCFIIYGYAPQCTPSQVVRMQVSADGSHMAFVTASQVTQYDNAGHLEMYTYDPEDRQVTCVSCLPSGAPPTTDVQASQDGLFMSNDGRAVFSTEDAIVPTDTNHALDVYEYVEGRPQLITPGTGDTRQPRLTFFATSSPGLIGISADGRDVYFSTYDTLVRQDHNGLYLKFYDARTGGGFSAPAPPPPCAAADECHGPASEAPAGLQKGTSRPLGTGGNASRKPTGRGKVHSKKRKRHRRRIKRHRKELGSSATRRAVR